MFPPEVFQPLLEEFAAILDRNQVKFAITGGLATSYYSEPRLTQDVDLIVERDRLVAVFERFAEEIEQSAYLFDRQRALDAFRTGRPFQFLHSVECLKLDVYPRELVPGELERSIHAEVFPGLMLPVVSLTDLAASKLVWIKRGSHKNRRDLRQLVARMNEAEIQQLRVIADERQLATLLDEVLAEPDEFEEMTS